MSTAPDKYVWNFRTIGGLPVISAPKLYNVTGTTATVFFAYEMNADVPDLESLKIKYRKTADPEEPEDPEVPDPYGLEVVLAGADYDATQGSTCLYTLIGLASSTEYKLYVEATNAAGTTYDKTYLPGPGTTVTTFKTEALTGNGTPEAPFQITTRSGLENIGKNVDGVVEYGLDKYYVLMNDIDVGAGNAITIAGPFVGNFNGNDKTIGTAENKLNKTLFAEIGEGGRVYDLNLLADIDDGDSVALAALAITNAGVIRNVTVDGTIDATATNAEVASVVHTNNGTVDGCVNNAVITAHYGTVGGIAYTNNSSTTVKYSRNNAALTAKRVGAIVYNNTVNGVVSYSENTGDITGEYVSGNAFINAGVITVCANNGTLTAIGATDEYSSGCMAGVNTGTVSSGCTCTDITHGHGPATVTPTVNLAGNL
ncbi:MAG: hypothetical protein ACOX2I_04175 [Candidatus Ozemobacteraceae bacterium]